MTSSIRILLIEDDPADRIQLEEVLDQALSSSPTRRSARWHGRSRWLRASSCPHSAPAM
ncbi:MAG: hypothetical protein R2873_00120 [Caldilineaceae bacterium]